MVPDPDTALMDQFSVSAVVISPSPSASSAVIEMGCVKSIAFGLFGQVKAMEPEYFPFVSRCELSLLISTTYQPKKYFSIVEPLLVVTSTLSGFAISSSVSPSVRICVVW